MHRHLVSVTVLVLLLLSTGAFCPALSSQLVIFRSHDYISRNYEIQHFLDTLRLEAGQLELPLTMTIYNGSAEAPSFKWFRILINGEIIATEQDLQGKEIASKDVSGIISGSNLQVQVEAGGVPGANLCWALSTEKMEFTGVEPQQVMPGQELRLLGSNIPSTPNLLTVNIGGKPAKIISANLDSMQVQVPESISPGVCDIEVRNGEQASNPISVSIISRPVPEILGLDVWMAPPGGTINISGHNFSLNARENKVYFAKVLAQVSSASSNLLTVIVPDWSWGPHQLNVPISVEVNGRCSNSFPIDIGNSYQGAIPQFEPD